MLILAALGVAGFIADRAGVNLQNTEVLKGAKLYDREFDPTTLLGVRLGWLGIVALIGLGIAIGYLVIRALLAAQDFQAATRLHDGAVDLPSLGTNALPFLDWTTTVERTTKATAGVGISLAVEGTRKLAQAVPPRKVP